MRQFLGTEGQAVGARHPLGLVVMALTVTALTPVSVGGFGAVRPYSFISTDFMGIVRSNLSTHVPVRLVCEEDGERFYG